MKKKIIYLSFILVLVISVITLSSIYKSKDNKYKKEYNTISKGMAIMIKEKGATDYVQSNSKDIPKGNYVLNEEKTYCENNGKVTNYNSATGTVSLNFIGSDRCYLYFDYKKETIKLGSTELVVNSEIPDFNQIATTNEGLFKAQDDLGTSYYFRGAVDNNWVKFGQESILSCTYNDEQVNGGKYDSGNGRIYGTYKISTQSECSGSGVCISRNFGPVIGVSSSECSRDGGTWVNSSPIYGGLKKESIFWRIIRINGDGSIRMIYTGTTAPTESTKVVMTGKGTQINGINYFFNVSIDKAEHVGYQYIEGQQHGYGKCNGTSASCPVNGGTVYNSRIKQEIDKWYAETTLKDNDLIADQIFCNDRSASTSDVAYSNTNYTTLTSWNSTGTDYYYGAGGRLDKSKNPQLTCPTASDKFTVNASNGNGALTYPVGLITADEVAMAGGVFITDNSSYYLYTNKDYWLGSPYSFDSSTSFDYGFHVSSSGALNFNLVSSTRGARPVISLSSKAKLTGDGTWNNVFEVSQKGYETILINNGNGATTVEEAKTYIEGRTTSTTPDFSTVATTNEGMYSAKDDLGTSYYFRGAVDNNWLKYGKYTKDMYNCNNDTISATDTGNSCTKIASSGDAIYWRIIRINGDNSIRMIYSGITPPTESTKVIKTEDTSLGNSPFNSNYDSEAYVGYMYTIGEQYGTSQSSDIKTYLEDWYANYTDLNKTGTQITDQIFCNDRIISKLDPPHTYYGANKRLIHYGINLDKAEPILTCPTASDKFTSKGSSIGNKKLEYPVGLITADEVSMAGGREKTTTDNSSYYLYTNQTYWSGSPSSFTTKTGSSGNFGASEFIVSSSGDLAGSPGQHYGYVVEVPPVDGSDSGSDSGSNSGSGNLYGVRPVVSLSSKVKLSGNGTYNDVYTVS